MDRFLWTVLLLSASGTILTLFVFAIKAVFGQKLSKRFLYYIWILVLLRLVIPVGISIDMNSISQPEEQNRNVLEQNQNVNDETIQSGMFQDVHETDNPSADNTMLKTTSIFSKISKKQLLYGGLICCWLLGTIIYLGYFFRSYYRFKKKIHLTNHLPSDSDRKLFNAMCPNKRLQLRRNSYVKSPMQIGILHPYIILPQNIDYGNEKELYYILLHEITHYTKNDLLVKKLVMVVTAFHWFNPVMILVRREINNACELACDETVIQRFSAQQRKQYGEMLLALSGNPIAPAGILSATLNEPKKILKERIVNIKRVQKRTIPMITLSIVLGIALTGCGAFFGIADNQDSTSLSSQPISPLEPTPITNVTSEASTTAQQKPSPGPTAAPASEFPMSAKEFMALYDIEYPGYPGYFTSWIPSQVLDYTEEVPDTFPTAESEGVRIIRGYIRLIQNGSIVVDEVEMEEDHNVDGGVSIVNTSEETYEYPVSYQMEVWLCALISGFYRISSSELPYYLEDFQEYSESIPENHEETTTLWNIVIQNGTVTILLEQYLP